MHKMKNLDETMNEGKEIALQLLSAQPIYFGSMKPSDIPEDIAGVYAIFENNTNEALYIGRTKKLRRRVYTNHLHGSVANARLKKYLVEDNMLPEIRDMESAKIFLKENCYVKYIIEEDVARRGKIEGLLSYLLDVRYIHEEH